ncbi:MAG: sodium:glutamate symporter [Candidatus Sumerlaeia bacterium]|nr:sodium:glutamate symporter [Candidatus Sumerlaeia bacterium]
MDGLTHLAVASGGVVELAAAMMIMGIVLLVGRMIRKNCKPIQALFLPTSVVAGVIAMLIGPQVLGPLAGRYLGEEHPLADGIIPQWAMDAWSELPKVLISVVFAGLLMGKILPSVREIWKKSGPQVLFGYTLAFGQYALGFTLVIFILTPFFGLDEKAGALMEIAFTGGHGTAAGLSATFEQVGFEEGRDLALGLATVGVVFGVIMGTLFVNIGVRSSKIIVARQEPTRPEEDFDIDQIHRNDQEEAPPSDDAEDDPLSQHLALIAVAIAIGWLLKQCLVLLEKLTWGRWAEVELMPLIPLFPLAMIGGVILQLILVMMRRERLIDRRVINRICGASLDIIIVAAMATISLEVLGGNIVPFLLFSLVAFGWLIFSFWVLAPRMMPDRWFERALGDVGQSSGMAVTGLLLMRIADPKNRSGAIEGFGYKQLLFEPFVGGGLITALSVPFTVQFGAVPMLIASLVLTIIFLTCGLVMGRNLRSA